MIRLVLEKCNVRPALHRVFIARCHIETVRLGVLEHAFLDRQLRFHVGIAAHHRVVLLLPHESIVEYF